jgi:hypothetical protein
MSLRIKIKLASLCLLWKGRKGENRYVEESKNYSFSVAFAKRLKTTPKAPFLFCGDNIYFSVLAVVT